MNDCIIFTRLIEVRTGIVIEPSMTPSFTRGRAGELNIGWLLRFTPRMRPTREWISPTYAEHVIPYSLSSQLNGGIMAGVPKTGKPE